MKLKADELLEKAAQLVVLSAEAHTETNALAMAAATAAVATTVMAGVTELQETNRLLTIIADSCQQTERVRARPASEQGE
jgi:uncharacterized protein YaaQ